MPGTPEEGTCRSQRLPVAGGGAVDVCLGQDELLRAETGPRGVHLCLGVFLLREWKERGSGSVSSLSAGREACSCSGGVVGGPQGRGALYWGAPAGPAPARLPVPLCFAQNQTPTDTCH